MLDRDHNLDHRVGNGAVKLGPLAEQNHVALEGSLRGNILIKLKYSGVNFVDTHVRTGLYLAQFPCTTGREGAETVDALGSEVGLGLDIGDRVAFFAPGSMTGRKGMFVTDGNSSGAIDAVRPLDLSQRTL
ncbi:hypothetical protein FDECE_14270 [Fusarium decemcellulare]|nr:hypothetical protein FDECE_14270 [Fusarium decemcellulare]